MSKSITRAWLPPAITLLLVGWGANQFASLLVFYQQAYGFSQLAVTSMLGIYVGGLIPALLLGGKIADRVGRKPATIVALLITVIASITMLFGPNWAFMIYVGRALAGVATGIAMAAATSWVKELSQQSAQTSASAGIGARRASLFTTAGFWLGPVVSGLLASFVPAPETVPYVLHIILCLPLFIFLRRLPHTKVQTATTPDVGKSAPRLAYPGAEQRFRKVIAPGAPWVFGAGTIGFAVIPALLVSLDGFLQVYSTVVVALTLGFGVAVQSLARRVDRPNSARAIITAQLVTVVGLVTGLATGLTQNLWLGLVASSLLGAGYGLMLAGGLVETQRVSSPEHLAATTGKFYTLAYAGYLAPTILAFFALWFDMLSLLVVVTGLGLLSLLVIVRNSKKYLPKTNPEHSTTTRTAIAPSTNQNTGE